MEYHLERRLRLITEPEYKNLYSWAIQEIDDHAKQIGRDQIPWDWTLSFTATLCVLADSIEVEAQLQSDEAAQPTVGQSQHIRVQLRPGHPFYDEDYGRETTFSMFGTDRAIKSFELSIYPITDPHKQERCTAWGSVSYTTEIDFRNDTSDDCVIFYLHVKPDVFARYGAKIAHGLVDEITFSVGSVHGFYSEWSPEISTRSVKVLTKGGESTWDRRRYPKFERDPASGRASDITRSTPAEHRARLDHRFDRCVHVSIFRRRAGENHGVHRRAHRESSVKSPHMLSGRDCLPNAYRAFFIAKNKSPICDDSSISTWWCRESSVKSPHMLSGRDCLPDACRAFFIAKDKSPIGDDSSISTWWCRLRDSNPRPPPSGRRKGWSRVERIQFCPEPLGCRTERTVRYMSVALRRGGVGVAE
jgi:hypothetical protein